MTLEFTYITRYNGGTKNKNKEKLSHQWLPVAAKLVTYAVTPFAVMLISNAKIITFLMATINCQ